MDHGRAAVSRRGQDVAGEPAREHIRLVLEPGVQQPDQTQGYLQPAAPAGQGRTGPAALR